MIHHVSGAIRCSFHFGSLQFPAVSGLICCGLQLIYCSFPLDSLRFPIRFDAVSGSLRFGIQPCPPGTSLPSMRLRLCLSVCVLTLPRRLAQHLRLNALHAVLHTAVTPILFSGFLQNFSPMSLPVAWYLDSLHNELEILLHRLLSSTSLIATLFFLNYPLIRGFIKFCQVFGGILTRMCGGCTPGSVAPSTDFCLDATVTRLLGVAWCQKPRVSEEPVPLCMEV